MAKFGDLPFELRAKIWKYTIPGPRILHVVHDYVHRSEALPYGEREFRVTPASYGLHHPVVLSVNRESRKEALRFLVKHIGAYWNMETDIAYFENLEAGHGEKVETFSEMYRAKLIAPFHNIALDATIWTWFASARYTGDIGNIQPRTIMCHMKKLRTVYLTYAWHTTQEDVVTPYRPWTIGDMSAQSCLDNEYHLRWAYQKMNSDFQRERIWSNIQDAQTFIDYEYKIAAVHDRVKEDSSPDQINRIPHMMAGSYPRTGVMGATGNGLGLSADVIPRQIQTGRGPTTPWELQ